MGHGVEPGPETWITPVVRISNSLEIYSSSHPASTVDPVGAISILVTPLHFPSDQA